MPMPRRRDDTEPVCRAKAAPGQHKAEKESRANFHGDLDNAVRDIKKIVVDISDKHNRSKTYVRSQLYGGSKSARFLRCALEIRLYDAYFHWKAKQMNEGLEKGERYGLEEIRDKILHERPNYKNRPAEEKQKWLDEYKADKDARVRKKRRNRRGEQQDAASTLKNVSTDLDTLHMRTGVRSVVFAVRSDILSTTEPFMFCDNDMSNFFSTALGKTPDQIARMMEMWSIHGQSSLAAPAPKNATELKSEIRKLMQGKLETIIAQRFEGEEAPKVKMNYVSYNSEIEGEYGVRFVRWTMNGGKWINPGDLTMADARALYKGLIDGSLYWEIVPENERGPAPTKKKRKTRSDKNGTHQKAAKTADGSDAASSSRKSSAASSSRKPSAKGKGKAAAEESDSNSDSGSGSGSDSE
ncbi:hypothetical protein EXIGLDRAFT_700943 [Exidia glandulosa HHB12029]|uniref:Uncharacterized protein n=1 Tax=Exidia glandulosa HHB12029 TaxID=1314781 RepID=A0A165D6W2_EXIGL|nr:hypothetical protein EXIGLDRAFT_700943 [Exidia glandulosa HHB12029]